MSWGGVPAIKLQGGDPLKMRGLPDYMYYTTRFQLVPSLDVGCYFAVYMWVRQLKSNCLLKGR